MYSIITVLHFFLFASPTVPKSRLNQRQHELHVVHILLLLDE